MQGWSRRIVFVLLYEAGALGLTTVGLAVFSRQAATGTFAIAVLTSAIAIVWAWLFNSLFEAWERRSPGKGRNLLRRVLHAVGFEGGLVVILVPLLAWRLGVSLLTALTMDLGLVVFFLVYTFVFNWCFDRCFGLPHTAPGA